MHRRHELNKKVLNLFITVSRDFFSISGSSRLPWQHFRPRDVIFGPSLDPMPDRARPSPPIPARKAFASNPDLQKRPHGQAGHVGQIRLSDWLKFPFLLSDWSVLKPTPCTTFA